MALVRRGRSIQSEKFARKRRKKLIFAAVLFFVAVISIIAAVLLFFRAGFVQIQSVSVAGTSLVPAGQVQADVEKDLTGSSAFLFSKNTLFFYPKDAIRAQLMADFPAIATIDFQSTGSFLGFGGNIGLHVAITERTPFALACTDDSGQTCFYMDESGFVYASSIASTSPTYIRYSLLQSSVLLFAVASTSSSTAPIITPSVPPAIAPGNPLVDSATFAAAKEVVAAVSGTGLDVVSDDIGADAYGPENQITIQDGAAQNDADATSTVAATTTLVYFNQSEPIDTELRYFTEFWQNEATSTAPALEYVDMRYGKDIVYKFY